MAPGPGRRTAHDSETPVRRGHLVCRRGRVLLRGAAAAGRVGPGCRSPQEAGSRRSRKRPARRAVDCVARGSRRPARQAHRCHPSSRRGPAGAYRAALRAPRRGDLRFRAGHGQTVVRLQHVSGRSQVASGHQHRPARAFPVAAASGRSRGLSGSPHGAHAQKRWGSCGAGTGSRRRSSWSGRPSACSRRAWPISG